MMFITVSTVTSTNWYVRSDIYLLYVRQLYVTLFSGLSPMVLFTEEALLFKKWRVVWESFTHFNTDVVQWVSTTFVNMLIHISLFKLS